MDNDDDEDDLPLPVIDRDPSGRFERYAKQLGKGAYKTVYRAFDQDEGVEVAWNQLRVDYLSDTDASKIRDEVALLAKLNHPNIIKLYYSWSAPNKSGQEMVYFITELMTSGTLKKYLRKTSGTVRPKFLKTVAVQILRALEYLHSREPPILHRDLKCDNIFINGNNGEVKLGDLGLATVRNLRHVTSVIGTPEFMAPELYDEEYDEKVDVYAFGMCLLEMVSKEYPYSECANQAQIYKRVTQGIKPEALKKIEDYQLRSIVDACLDSNPDHRPTAAALLELPFWKVTDTPILGPQRMSPSEKWIKPAIESLMLTSSVQPTSTPSSRQSSLHSPSVHTLSKNVFPIKPVVNGMSPLSHGNVELVRQDDEKTLILKLSCRIAGSTRNQAVKFPFILGADTSEEVVAEMIREEVLAEADKDVVVKNVQSIIDRVISGERISDIIAHPKPHPPYPPQQSRMASPKLKRRSISSGSQPKLGYSGYQHQADPGSVYVGRSESAHTTLHDRPDYFPDDVTSSTTSLPAGMLAAELAALTEQPKAVEMHQRATSQPMVDSGRFERALSASSMESRISSVEETRERKRRGSTPQPIVQKQGPAYPAEDMTQSPTGYGEQLPTEAEIQWALSDDPELQQVWLKQQREAEEMQRTHRAEWNRVLAKVRLHREQQQHPDEPRTT